MTDGIYYLYSENGKKGPIWRLYDLIVTSKSDIFQVFAKFSTR